MYMHGGNHFNLWPALSSVLPPTRRAVRYLGWYHSSPLGPVSPATRSSREAFQLPGCIVHFFQFYASDWIYCSMFHAMIVIDISTSRKREAVYSQYCLQRLKIAFAEAVRPEPPGGWSRPPEDIDEGLIDGSLCRVPESNRNAVEEDDVLDLDVIDPDVLDSTVQYDLG